MSREAEADVNFVNFNLILFHGRFFISKLGACGLDDTIRGCL